MRLSWVTLPSPPSFYGAFLNFSIPRSVRLSLALADCFFSRRVLLYLIRMGLQTYRIQLSEVKFLGLWRDGTAAKNAFKSRDESWGDRSRRLDTIASYCCSVNNKPSRLLVGMAVVTYNMRTPSGPSKKSKPSVFGRSMVARRKAEISRN